MSSHEVLVFSIQVQGQEPVHLADDQVDGGRELEEESKKNGYLAGFEYHVLQRQDEVGRYVS